MNTHILTKRFFLFALVGASGTLIHYLILLLLVEGLYLHAVVASSIGAIGGAVWNYVLNYRITFQSRQAHRAAGPKFACVAASGLVLNGLVMHVWMSWTQLHYFAGQLVSTTVVLAWTFFANHLWTFQGDSCVGR